MFNTIFLNMCLTKYFRSVGTKYFSQRFQIFTSRINGINGIVLSTISKGQARCSEILEGGHTAPLRRGRGGGAELPLKDFFLNLAL